ncbi:MAG TPA: glycosyltransferase family 2 protein [Candidatus Dojkabacteria bacterium]|nr:glycosyltransferase family 2 protein [Candidatus Dojkabacteria bacterium]
MKLVVFTFAHNEEKTIEKVLNGVPKKIDGISEITKLVIDDGSTDSTAKVAKKAGAHVIKNGNQKRLSYSFQVAVDYALENGADIAVNIDADLQMNPTDIPLLVAPIVEGRADFVSADRFSDPETGKFRRPENMPFGKYLGNLMGAFIVSKLSGKRFNDVTCGFRAYNRKALLNVNINTKDTYTQESFQILATKKLNILQIPVIVKYYKGRKSRVVTSVFKYISRSSLNIIRAFRDYAPLRFFSILGSLFFVPGLLLMLFTGIHWLNTGTFTPYKFVGILGIYAASLGILTYLFGIVADMLDRVIHNQEKILYYLKSTKYDKKK